MTTARPLFLVLFANASLPHPFGTSVGPSRSFDSNDAKPSHFGSLQ
jgi:hypothetical protein